jgi:hypothetical protein
MTTDDWWKPMLDKGDSEPYARQAALNTGVEADPLVQGEHPAPHEFFRMAMQFSSLRKWYPRWTDELLEVLAADGKSEPDAVALRTNWLSSRVSEIAEGLGFDDNDEELKRYVWGRETALAEAFAADCDPPPPEGGGPEPVPDVYPWPKEGEQT